METKNYICGGTKFAFGKGYIAMSVPVPDIPEKMVVEGEVLLRKTSFHVSLACVKDIVAVHEGTEQKILDCFCAVANEFDISFVRYTGEFRFARDGERVTVIALCEVSNLSAFANRIKSELGIDVPEQPTHVTLYTLQPDAGIGLNSPEAMERMSSTVDVPEDIESGLTKLE